MTSPPCWQVALRTSAQAEEAVGALMTDLFGAPAVAVSRPEAGTTELSVFCERAGQCSGSRLAAFKLGLKTLRAGGLPVGPGRVRVKRLSACWADSWRRHFPPLLIRGVLLLRPTWHRKRARRGQVEIVLDPGLSFGTGHHPTTRFCLEQIVATRAKGEPPSFLDLGTGSGILALAAAGLGYRPVEAIDSDRAAIRVARENARRNGLAGRIRFRVADALKPQPGGRRSHNLVCANLQADTLVEGRRSIVDRLSPGGRLVLAGILSSEFEVVARNYRALGLRLDAAKRGREWTSGTFVSPGFES
jgi:ribosomal protein L11 methyltransferase